MDGFVGIPPQTKNHAIFRAALWQKTLELSRQEPLTITFLSAEWAITWGNTFHDVGNDRLA